MANSQRLEEWIRAGRNLQLAGRRIFVRTAAAPGKPPLLLIHGFPTASYDWHRLWLPLAANYSLYAFDMLGFGLSEKPADCDYPIALQADLCQALFDHFGVCASHVLAHDYGDTVAQELLAREREGRIRLDSVCFLNGGLFPETHRPRLVQKLLARPLLGPWLARRMSYPQFESTMLSIAGQRPPARDELEDLWELIQRENGREALARLINYMEQRRRNRERWVGALVESMVPRRLICGAVDPVSGAHLAERYRQLVPEPDVVVLENVGHYPQLEEHERVFQEYLRFRERVATSGSRTKSLHCAVQPHLRSQSQGPAMTLHTLCRTDELPKGKMKAFNVEGEKLVLYHLDDGFYATQASCTHVFAPLAKGKILDGCKVQCPFHRARFDIRTGEVIDWANFPPGIQVLNVVRGEKALKTYKVSVKDGDVRVSLSGKA